ncbi:glycosyltransferase involved in cell wall biosynthesis [Rhizobium azibense]|uniref:Glycosyltransferase involved in cell wall biosynthesis n=2 Tax=Rhizobium azibense TaxID=1136135 RepID=A0A4R3RFR2_9HYPH|nr:glycosyltransferase involved in cell wall biosynthesis [Rhizobium azibense]
MAKADVMHIITNFTAHAGAETMLARLLHASVDQRILVVSLMGISERNLNISSNPSVEYVSLEAMKLRSLARALPKLARLIRHERPPVIVCWMYHAMIVGTIAALLAHRSTAVIWNIRQSLDDWTSLTRSSRAAVIAAKWLSWHPKGFIFNSARALEMHAAAGYRTHNAVVIPNGFELPQSVTPQPRSVKRIGIAARFHPQKDYPTFFKAAARLLQTHQGLTFVAAGRGLSWSNPAVPQMILSAGLAPENVQLLGEVDDMADFYRSIDILALSSRTEGFPNVLAEAMSYGLPVVTTDVGDAASIIGDGGLAVPSQNPEALAAALRTLLDSGTDRYAEYAAAARRRIEEEYDLGIIVRKYDCFLKQFKAAVEGKDHIAL